MSIKTSEMAVPPHIAKEREFNEQMAAREAQAAQQLRVLSAQLAHGCSFVQNTDELIQTSQALYDYLIGPTSVEEQ